MTERRLPGRTRRTLPALAVILTTFGLLVPPSAFAQNCLTPHVIQCNAEVTLSVDFVNDEDTYPGCGATGYAGADTVFQFTPAAGTEFFVRVSDNEPAVDIDLIVVEDTCETGACVSYTPRAADGFDGLIDGSHIADGGDYFLHVDDAGAVYGGWQYGLGTFCNTCDSVTDVAAVLTCSSDLIGQSSVGGTNSMNYYTCGAPYPQLGQLRPENIYEFTPQATGTVTFTLDNMTTDHDLYVLEDLCSDQNCIAGSTDASTGTDSVTFTAVVGVTYYIVVEAFGGGGSFDLFFQDDTGGCSEDCDDGTDNDFDGDIDCSDSDCFAEPECALELCSNGIDDDGDGFADYPNDPGCADAQDDSEHDPAGPHCDNGIDDDGDGSTDFGGGDLGCAGPTSAKEDPQCQDGKDNDGDGLTDGADPQCSSPSDDREARSLYCGLGIELTLILPLLGALRARRRRLL